MKTREFIVAIIFIIASLIVQDVFPAEGIFQQVVVMLVFFMILPLLFNRFIFKRENFLLSFKLNDYKNGMIWSTYSLIAISVIFLIWSYYFEFLNKYSVPVFITKDFFRFISYEFIVVAPFVVIYEFYFRGIIMTIFKPSFGYWAILIQSLIFWSLVFGENLENIIQFVPYLVVAPFAGFIAYKSRSILYSAAVQFIVLFILNIIVIKRIG